MKQIPDEMIINYMSILHRIAQVGGISEGEAAFLNHLETYADFSPEIIVKIKDKAKLDDKDSSFLGLFHKDDTFSSLFDLFDEKDAQFLKKYLFRDCVRVVMEEGGCNPAEQQMLKKIISELDLSEMDAQEILDWVIDDNALQAKWEIKILRGMTEEAAIG